MNTKATDKKIARVVKYVTGMIDNYRAAIQASIRIGDATGAATYTVQLIRFLRTLDPNMQANLL